MRRLLLTGLAGVAGFALAMQGESVYTSRDESFVVRNVAHQTTHTEDDGILVFSVQGAPAIIERKDSGLTMSGRSITGHAAPDEKSYYLVDGQFSGTAQLLQDSVLEDGFRKAHNLPLAKRSSEDRTELDTERFDYLGTRTEGTVAIPGVLTMTMHSVGTRTVKKKVKGVDVTGPEIFDQMSTLNAMSGSIALDPRPGTAPEKQLRKGELAGPVKLHVTRGAKGPGDVSVVVTNLDLTADKMSLDFTGAERKITLTGHIVITGDNTVFGGTTRADKAVVVVDEKFRVKSIDTTGDPTDTQIKKVGGSR